MTEQPTYSLHRRLLIWLLGPLLVMSTAILFEAYYSARESARTIYDRLLVGLAFSIAEHAVITKGDLLSAETLDVMTQATNEKIYYKVTGPGNAFVSGYIGLPPVPEDRELEGGTPIFYNAVYEGEPVRMVALSTFVDQLDLSGWVVVQVLQTKGERDAMVWQAVTRSALHLFGVLLLAAAATWVGISRGLIPLQKLERHIQQRSSRDLSPVREIVPQEIEQMVTALNNLLGRLARHVSTTKAFVETASHQLRTPLTALRTRIELARRESKTEWGRHAFDAIHLDTVRAARLADQLLSLARVGPEALGGDLEENIDLKTMAADVAREWVKPALARGMELEFETEPDEVRVDGNKTLLCEILNNLMDNAICYCPEGTRITLRAGRTSSDRVYLEVEDNGPGIPERDHVRVFERFVRLEPDSGPGCGLGLPIVKEIVVAHRGTIELGTPPAGSGLLVRVELPTSQADRLVAMSHRNTRSDPLAVRNAS